MFDGLRSAQDAPADLSDLRSVRRAFAVLDLLVAMAPCPIRGADVARQLGVSPATASRILGTLVEEGYASRTLDRRYTIGVSSLPLATGWLGQLRKAAKEPASRVAEQAGEVVVLSQMLGGEQVPVLWRVPQRHQGIASAVLDRMIKPYSVWTTASGRAMLAGLSSAQRGRLLPSEPASPVASGRPPISTTVKKAVQTGVKNGIHREVGEVQDGMYCWSVPVAPSEAGECLAIAAVCLGKPNALQERRIQGALREAAFDTALGLSAEYSERPAWPVACRAKKP